MDRHDRVGARARVPAVDRAPPRARRRGRDHRSRLRADPPAARAARARGDGARPPRRPVAARQGARADVAAVSAQALGQGTQLRRRARARLARADADRAPAADSERDDLRLRVRMAPAPARLPRGHARRRAGRNPARPAGPLRRAAAEASSVRRPEGGVLPRRLRAGPRRARSTRARRQPDARRPAPAARRLALPPTLESALPRDAAARRQPRGLERRSSATTSAASSSRRWSCPTEPSTRRA